MDDVAAVRSDAPFVARAAELDRLRRLTAEAAATGSLTIVTPVSPLRVGTSSNCSRRYGPQTAGRVRTIRSGAAPFIAPDLYR